GGPFVPEADKEVRGKTDEPPADEQQQQIAALDEQQHREDEERDVREVAPLFVDAIQVSHRVEDDQAADTGDDQHHHHAERVDDELETAAIQGDYEAQPDAHLRRGDGHHRKREDLARAVRDVPREGDQREIRAVQHDLEREQDDQRISPDQHAERADPEKE